MLKQKQEKIPDLKRVSRFQSFEKVFKTFDLRGWDNKEADELEFNPARSQLNQLNDHLKFQKTFSNFNKKTKNSLFSTTPFIPASYKSVKPKPRKFK